MFYCDYQIIKVEIKMFLISNTNIQLTKDNNVRNVLSKILQKCYEESINVLKFIIIGRNITF